ncbi:MAG: flippase-like domain-containing protein [Rikenellaceae bacterium]|jgi:uncharacterized protein (TIRG00374 family)|nr:flippase-like domain-containing protein [Rikenellaceae bacterium]
MPQQPPKANPVGKIRVRNAVYPILIGLAVVGWMLYRDFDPRVFDNVIVSWHTVFWIFVAFACMFGRDLGYIVRIKVFSGGQLSWGQAFRVIMLWEFTSAITPSAVGGTSVAILYVHKEGISIGKSSAMVMLTSFFDELYFVLMFPLVVLAVGRAQLFDLSALSTNLLSMSLITVALIGYLLKLAWTLILTYGLFINPRGLKWLLLKVFKTRLLRRWYRPINRIGTDIILSSRELKTKGVGFWLKGFFSTFVSWSSRYLVANALIMAFFGYTDQLILFARQLVLWIMMLVMPTPGGSGFAEYIFTHFLGDRMPVAPELQLAAGTLVAVAWRLITYYPYLIVGAVVFPRWINRHFSHLTFRRKS